jgi:hypothetical protein
LETASNFNFEFATMARTPEERREINRRNAQRSCGPRTPEGKSRARLNALKHGLRAEEFALPGEDQEDLKRLSDEWVDYYAPRSPGERAVLDRCVYATVQLKRCARYHAEAVAEQVRKAQEAWDHQQEDEVAELQELLKTDPATAVRRLKRSARGCRWLIHEWDNLRTTFLMDRLWGAGERDQAIRLLGARPDPENLYENVTAYFVRFHNVFSRREVSAEAADWITDPKRMPDTFRRSLPKDWEHDPKASQATLRQVVEDELTALLALEERLRTELEDPSRAGLVYRSLLLEGPKGALLARYERMHDAAYHRAYKTLLKGELQHEDELAPTPVVTPAHLEGTAAVLDITAAKTGAPNEAIATLTSGVAKVRKGAFPVPEGLVEPVVGPSEGVTTDLIALVTADPPPSPVS